MYQSSAFLLLLVDVSVKALLLALFAVAGMYLLRVQNSHVRHRVWTAVLCSMLWLPLLVHIVPGLAIPVPNWLGSIDSRSVASGVGTNAGVTGSGDLDELSPTPNQRSEFSRQLAFRPARPSATGSGSGNSTPQADSATAATSSAAAHWRERTKTALRFLMAIYLTVCGVLVLRLLLLLGRTFALVSHSRELMTDWSVAELSSTTKLYECPLIRVPQTFGFWRPRVLLPSQWRDWGDEKRQAVLRHEATHVARGDYLVNLLAECNRCVYWFNPLAWWLIHWLSDLAERNCDDAVIATTGDRTSYARHLLEIASSVAAQMPVPQSGVSMARSADVATRIDAILDSERTLSSQVSWLGSLVLVMVILPIVWLSASLQGSTTSSSTTGAESTDEAAKSAVVDSGDDELLSFVGRVVNANQDPIVGARILIVPVFPASGEKREPRQIATSGERGHFKFTHKLDSFRDLSQDVLVATAGGFGPDWINLSELSQGREQVFELVRDDIPIEGRILDLEGKPVVGAKVTVQSARAMRSGDLQPYIDSVKAGNGSNFRFDKFLFAGIGIEPQFTDQQGRFRLLGIGRQRRVDLEVSGRGIENSILNVVTQDIAPIIPRDQTFFSHTVYGAKFNLLSKPSRPIVGTIVDADTGKPIAGISVGMLGSGNSATSDAGGRFELLGCGKANFYRLLAFVEGSPYLLASERVADTDGLLPIETRIEMTRGIMVSGRVIDQATGQPLSASLSYYPLFPNDNLRPGIGGSAANAFASYSQASTNRNGEFSLPVLPGPGFIGIKARARTTFQPAQVDAEAFYKKAGVPYATNSRELNGSLALAVGGGGSSVMPQSNFHAIELLNLPGGSDDAAPIDIQLQPAPRLAGVLVDVNGKPVVNAVAYGLEGDLFRPHRVIPTDSFTVSGMTETQDRQLYFRHDKLRLAAVATAVADMEQPLRVTMRKWGELRGRLIGQNGEPLGSIEFGSTGRQDGEQQGRLPRMATTDEEGRFHIEGLVPGQTYELGPFQGGPRLRVSLQPGELVEAGDVNDLFEWNQGQSRQKN